MTDRERIEVLEAALEKILFLEPCRGDCRVETCPAGVAQVALGREPTAKDPCCDHYDMEKRLERKEAELEASDETIVKLRQEVEDAKDSAFKTITAMTCKKCNGHDRSRDMHDGLCRTCQVAALKAELKRARDALEIALAEWKAHADVGRGTCCHPRLGDWTENEDASYNKASAILKETK